MKTVTLELTPRTAERLKRYLEQWGNSEDAVRVMLNYAEDMIPPPKKEEKKCSNKII